MIANIAREAYLKRMSYLRTDAPAPSTDTYCLRCVTVNTHRGQGPKLPYLLNNASAEEAERIELMHETRAYAYFIADWLNRRRHEFDVIALQEVFLGVLGIGDKILGKYRQRDHYRIISGYSSFVEHGVGFAGFRYQNLLLSQLPKLSDSAFNRLLPGKMAFLASSGFTLAPFLLHDRIVWIGNTHLHAYNPKSRMKQAAQIAGVIESLGDTPILFLGDLNTVPPGCRDSDFPAGERDVNSYRGDRSLDILSDAGLQIVHHRDSKEFHTYPTGAANRTLDYIMFTRHWRVNNYRVLTDMKFSDHYPVYAELELEQKYQ